MSERKLSKLGILVTIALFGLGVLVLIYRFLLGTGDVALVLIGGIFILMSCFNLETKLNEADIDLLRERLPEE